jgi:hypothetical protein
MEEDKYLDTMFGGGFKYNSLHTAGVTAIKMEIVKVKSFVDNYVPIPPPSATVISFTKQPQEPDSHTTATFLRPSESSHLLPPPPTPVLQGSQSAIPPNIARDAPTHPVLLSHPILTADPTPTQSAQPDQLKCVSPEGLVLPPNSPNIASRQFLTNKRRRQIKK